MNESTNKNQQIKTFVGVIVGILAYFLVKQFLFAPISFDKALMKTASELNKVCPMMVDKETQLDNTIALPDNVFQYNYTLVNLAQEDLVIDDLKASLETQLIQNIKNNPDMNVFRTNEVTMNYAYKDKNNRPLTKIVITPDMYK